MRVLKRKYKKSIVRELKERQFYMKPSEKKREPQEESIKNVKKRMPKLERLRGFNCFHAC